jgi:CRP-like cAMP-binding protein
MAAHPNFRQNAILDSLPGADYKRLYPNMEQVVLVRGDVLQEPGTPMSHVYFPSTSIVSLMSVMENGNSVEIAAVGNEGMVGVAQVTNANAMSTRAVVQKAGWAIQVKEHVISKEFDRIGGRRKGLLHDLLMRYTQRLINEITQTAICNQHHKLDQQLCRWLLLRLDRQVSNELDITQELIANSMGFSRNAISQAAGKLQHSGLISYKRGRLKVLDRVGLEMQTCECYKAVVRAPGQGLMPVQPSLTPVNSAVQYRPINREAC